MNFDLLFFAEWKLLLKGMQIGLILQMDNIRLFEMINLSSKNLNREKLLL